MLKNKRALKEIAKRWAKGALFGSACTAFQDSGLTRDEDDYIIKCIDKIALSITELPINNSSDSLVSEYFE